MNKKLIGFVVLAMVALSCKDKQNGLQAQVRMYEIPAPLKDRPEQILHRKGYTTSYNQQTKTPNWVA